MTSPPPSARAMEKAISLLTIQSPRFALYRSQDADFRQNDVEFWARALDAERAEVWEEAAKIADSVIDPVDSPLTALSSQAAKFIAQLIRARAAALRVERKG